MALGKLLTRSTVYTAVDTVTGTSATYTVVDNLGPDWPTSSAYRGGLGIPGAWRATMMLHDLVGGLSYEAFRKPIGKPEEMIEPTPPLLSQPNPPDTPMTTFGSCVIDLLWEGNAVLLVAARNFEGWPTAAIPVPACNVGVRRVPRFDPSPLAPGSVEYAIGDLRFSADEVIHIKGPCRPGALRGMGVLEHHLNTFMLAQGQQRQALALTNPGVPTGVLKVNDPDFEEDDAIAMKARWLESQRTRTIAVVNGDTEFIPLNWTPEEAQVVELRKLGLNDMELIFGLPVGWLGGMASTKTYSNIGQDATALHKFGTAGHVQRFEQTLSLHYPRGTVVRANMDDFLRGDTLTRFEAYGIAIDKKIMVRNEVRKREHLKPLPGGDKFDEPVTPPALAPSPNGAKPADDDEDAGPRRTPARPAGRPT